MHTLFKECRLRRHRTSREMATNKLPAAGLTTQVILGAQDNSKEHSSNSLTNPVASIDGNTTNESLPFVAPPGTPSWRIKEAPRLLQTDTAEHVQSVVTQFFGAGVDIDLFLAPARTVIDHLTKDERVDYTKKGLKLMGKIPASWKRWKAMDNSQKIKLISFMFILSPEHACILERSVEATNTATSKEDDDAISLNRTMHGTLALCISCQVLIIWLPLPKPLVAIHRPAYTA
jgi:hypothetical protein